MTRSFKIGIGLAASHLIFSIVIASDIAYWSSNAQWQFGWFFPFAIDFPISLLYLLVFYLLPFSDFSVSFLPYPISEVRGFILPFLLHSIIGTLWYFYLPLLVSKLANKTRKKVA